MKKQKKTQYIYISSKNSYNPHTKSIALFFIMDYTLKCEVQKKLLHLLPYHPDRFHMAVWNFFFLPKINGCNLKKKEKILCSEKIIRRITDRIIP